MKKISFSLLIILLLTMSTSQAFAINKTVKCDSGSACIANNQITKPNVTGYLYFSGASSAGSEYPYGKIVATRAKLIAFEGDYPIVTDDSGKDSSKYANVGALYGNCRKGIVYKNEITHFFYKNDGTAYTDTTTTTFVY